MKPLCIDLFCGLGGWAEGFLSEGYDVVGFDIEARPYPGQLVLQDVLTLHGRQFRNAAVIVASPPCQAYSYRAMPWKRAKALPPPDNALFDACFRIQREASKAAGRYIPMVVENVKGAQPWVGRAKWHYGSYYLWGDVPALMPTTLPPAKVAGLANGTFPGGGLAQGFLDRNTKGTGGSWFNVAHNTESGVGQNPVNGVKVPSLEVGRRTDIGKGARFTTRDCGFEGVKQPGHSGRAWFADPDVAGHFSSKSPARKLASALIAKIPLTLAQHIARVYKPESADWRLA